MALLTIGWFSQSLNRQTTVQAVVPIEGRDEATPLPALYLLHGIMADHTQWLVGSRIAELARRWGVAVIMPAGDNSFYVDQEAANSYYGQYVGQELVAESRKLLPLSHDRRDTWIGGLSMGGYGAIRNGLKYADTFGAVVALSSALVIDRAIESTEDAEWAFARRQYFTSVFGDLGRLRGSDKDVEALAERVKTGGGALPRLYLACGTEDRLVEANRRYHALLTGLEIEHTYVEGPGGHDFAFWDSYIERALEWLRPL